MRNTTQGKFEYAKSGHQYNHLFTYENKSEFSQLHTICKHVMNQYVWSNEMNCNTQNWPEGPLSALNL